MDDLISRLAAVTRRKRVLNQAPVPMTGSREGLFARSADPDGDRSYDAYGSVGTLFAIVSQITNAFASTEWHLYQRTSVRDKKKRKEILSHPFLTVWNRPNEFYTSRFFRETVQQHIELVGEGAIVLNKVGGIIVEMWPVRPDRIRPVRHPQKFLTGYIYKSPDGEEVPLDKDQVIHIKLPNPSDPYRGMGPVQTVLNDIDAARYSAEWNRNFFINGAQPGGIIEVDYTMGDDEFRRFVRRWREQHQGVANAHRVAILENAKWVDTKFSMEDMQFVELRNLPRELIREAFAFPKPMLGTVDDVNRANSEASKEIMATGQTIPRLSRWYDIINNFLLPQFANGKSLEFDYDDPTPVNIEQTIAELTGRTNALVALVNAGFNADDAADATGMPRMEYNSPSVASAAQPALPPGEDTQARRKPILAELERI